MKCPKCGFTSFDDLQDCKKCGSDLSDFRSKFSLRSLLRPFAAAPETTTEIEQTPPAPEHTSAAGDATDFGYDFMEETVEESVEETATSLDDLLDAEAPEQSTAEELDFLSQFLQEDAEKEAPDLPEMPTSEDRPDGEPLDLEVDFNWDDSEEVSERQAEELKEFDIPSLEDLPPLDDLGDQAREETAELPEFSDLPDLEDLDELEEEDPPQTEGKTRDPFDVRGTSETGAPPASSMSHAHEVPPHAPLIGPDRDAVPEGPSAVVLPAPISLRLRAGIVDTAILGLAFILFLSAGEMILKGEIFPSAASFSELIIPYFLIFFFLCFWYFTLFHSLTGQTIGKMLFDLRVEAVGGEPLLFSQAFLRAAGGVLCLMPFGLGFLQILRAPEGRGMNDRLAGTWVVQAREEEDELGGEEYVET